MSKVQMIGYKVSDLSIVNHYENTQRIQTKSSCSYSVTFTKNGICIGTFKVDMEDSEKSGKFAVHAVVSGFFRYPDDEKQETVHVLTHQALFPYVRALITTVTVNAGMAPIILPEVDPMEQGIYRINKNPQ